MAMMMTGRVLLVCALCVLWCGLSGVAADGAGVVSDGSADEDLLLQWRAWLRRESAEEVSRRTGGWENASAVEEFVHQGMEGVRAVVDGRRRWRRQRIAVAAAAGNGDVITDKDGQARNNEVSPPEIKDEKPVASGQESTDATRGKDQTTQNPSVAIVSRTKLISDQQQEECERMTEKEDGGNEDEEAEDEAKIRETPPVVPPPSAAAAGGGIKPPSGASGPAGPGAILTSRSSSGVDSSSRIGDEGSTVGISPNAVGKPSKKDKVPEAKENQHAQPHDGVAADTLNNGPKQNGSAPTTGQNENEVATLGAGGSHSSGEQITAKGGSEASRTDESSANPNKKLQESEKTPLKPSQAAATEPKTQQEVLTSVKEETKSKSTDASANLPDAPKSSDEHPASAATTMQSTSTGSQEAAATPSSNRIPPLHEETTTGTNTTENTQHLKEKPVEATKTTTATTGDSDSSTAVSHTTSPLLLLLVVFACAAAAAVVAA
ncbi:mucin-associated surface protein [Trypanosoma cruzi cruzi]|uniref:Mucin-associated surface protein (MASP) n=1 Tax=Trypanosoma cruzi TaxID=5693 RepID=A0A2V2W2K1_TRYCR|nr:mucin-associated surface protein [Trypanosoma cruzi cruzi]PWV01943.1 Mucin-associated surface protein (MASP) [Trypanosoma cruzi]